MRHLREPSKFKVAIWGGRRSRSWRTVGSGHAPNASTDRVVVVMPKKVTLLLTVGRGSPSRWRTNTSQPIPSAGRKIGPSQSRTAASICPRLSGFWRISAFWPVCPAGNVKRSDQAQTELRQRPGWLRNSHRPRSPHGREVSADRIQLEKGYFLRIIARN
jgi:hypothetical protein